MDGEKNYLQKYDEEVLEREIIVSGYDVINNNFFVSTDELVRNKIIEKVMKRQHIYRFDSFADYYDFLDGNIYENAIYYQWNLKGAEDFDIDIKRLNAESLITATVDEMQLELSEKEREEYKQVDKMKKDLLKILNKLKKVKSYRDLENIDRSYKNSKLYKFISEERKLYGREYGFLVYWYLLNYIGEDESKIEAMIKSASKNAIHSGITWGLCTIFGLEKVLKYYNYDEWGKGNKYKTKNKLSAYITDLEFNNYKNKKYAYFDEYTHFYCERTEYFTGKKTEIVRGGVKVYRWFSTFEEFIAYRDGDITNTNLSKVIDLDYDFSTLKMDKTTILPLTSINNYREEIVKEYDDNKFYVSKNWYDQNDNVVKTCRKEFQFFYDFVAYLKNDLSNAVLYNCDGLKNLKDIEQLNLTGALITSDVCNSLGLPYKKITYNTEKTDNFDTVIENEEKSLIVYNSQREQEFISYKDNRIKSRKYEADEKIYYISDIHLGFRLKNNNVRNEVDILKVFVDIVMTIVNHSFNVVVICGDVDSDYELYERFVKLLDFFLKRSGKEIKVIFTLGNHELWSFADLTIDDTVNKYRELLNEHGFYLLHNEIIYDDGSDYRYITEGEINSLSCEELREKLKNARKIFFGGIGFTGYNEEHNATSGLYLFKVSKKKDKFESDRFNALYEKVVQAVHDKRVIVCSHMPMDCWRENVEYNNDFIYVSGHTHYNAFLDDGKIRIYADNQVGYRAKNIYMKFFEIKTDYDLFVDYKDGIYEISRDDYIRFYRAKYLAITFNRDYEKLYMVKKNGYYCFVTVSAKGSYCILNAGASKKINIGDIKDVYDKMDKVISRLDEPLKKYRKKQEKLSKEICTIGGSGIIHGCIIDIDYYNHVYLNPIDGKITPYWALDVIYKIAYPSVEELLKARCPRIYENYKKLELEDKKKEFQITSLSIKKNEIEVPQEYLSTDIYIISKELKKMEKLDSNILTTWY